METDDLQAQLSQLQQLIADEEQKRQRQKVHSSVSCSLLLILHRILMLLLSSH